VNLHFLCFSELQRFNHGLVGRVLMENIAQCKQCMLLHICCSNSDEQREDMRSTVAYTDFVHQSHRGSEQPEYRRILGFGSVYLAVHSKLSPADEQGHV
jgi:hypothetical protein